MIGRPKEDLAERFWRYVTKGDGCWEWQGSRLQSGYGQMQTDFTNRAHRVSWFLHNGPIPDELLVCHRCDNKACVRPDHLFLGTERDNMLDMVRKGRNPPAERHWRKTRPWLAAAASARYSGEKHYMAVLTAEQVMDFRRRAAAGEPTRPRALALGLPYGPLIAAIRGISWKHLPGAVPKRSTHPKPPL